MEVEYDGSDYGGWQIQPNAPTVQGKITKALSEIMCSHITVMGAGRTDKGVHARRMIASAPLYKKFPIEQDKICKAINSRIPHDIRIRKAIVADADFNARYHAIAREYKYTMIDSNSVFHNRFAAFMKLPFKPELLFDCAPIFVGEHDFTSFSKFNPKINNYICNVEICHWNEIDANTWQLSIKADRFVYGMVRSLVGAMYECSRGKLSTARLKEMLDEKDRELLRPLAPSHGLVFERAYYTGEFNYFDQ
jgi:tRNA pseudouridine38-40 synthase